MRPLFFEYPDDGRAWAIWDEFLYGQDILVAPVRAYICPKPLYRESIELAEQHPQPGDGSDLR